MKNHIHTFFVLIVTVSIISSPVHPQELTERHRPTNPPFLLPPLQRAAGFSNASSIPAKSFYKSKAEWQTIIDSIWGPGLPLKDKLAAFDLYAINLSIVRP